LLLRKSRILGKCGGDTVTTASHADCELQFQWMSRMVGVRPNEAAFTNVIVFF